MINIKTNSRKVKPGDTFVAIKGFTVDGHDYIEDAIKAGATKIVCEHGSYSVETLVVPSTKEWVQKYIVDNYKETTNMFDKEHHEMRREIELQIDKDSEDPELEILYPL